MAYLLAFQSVLIMLSLLIACQVLLGVDWMAIVIRTSLIGLGFALILFGILAAVEKFKPVDSKPETPQDKGPAAAKRPVEKAMAKAMR